MASPGPCSLWKGWGRWSHIAPVPVGGASAVPLYFLQLESSNLCTSPCQFDSALYFCTQERWVHGVPTMSPLHYFSSLYAFVQSKKTYPISAFLWCYGLDLNYLTKNGV